MPIGSRREGLDIIADILESTLEESKTMSIISDDIHANYSRTREYVELSLENELLTDGEIEGSTEYRTTEKGEKFLELYDELKSHVSK